MFDIFNKDMDDVIMLINYYIERGEDKETKVPQSGSGKREERIRVNDKTATGGWY